MKLVKYLAVLFAIAAFSFTLQSCMDNDSSSEKFGICTINLINADSNEYYFTLDDGKTMFPNNSKNWTVTKDKDGQRAFVIFDWLDEPVKGYDYNINLKAVREILTKQIVTLGEGENTEEALGDDKINTTYMWYTNDLKYLTIEYQFRSTLNDDKKHFLNLVINDTKNEETYSDNVDYINLEFRHNSDNDGTTQIAEGYVSFKLDNVANQIKDKKGLRIRVNTLNDGIKYYEVPFSSVN